jgi:anti-anti-sigma regulatory factor
VAQAPSCRGYRPTKPSAKLVEQVGEHGESAEQTVVAVTGEIDVSVTDRLRERLGEELSLNPRALIVDLTGIPVLLRAD